MLKTHNISLFKALKAKGIENLTKNERLKFVRLYLQDKGEIKSQKHLADYLGIPISTMSAAESYMNYTRYIINKIEKLDISVDWLITGKGNMFINLQREKKKNEKISNLVFEIETVSQKLKTNITKQLEEFQTYIETCKKSTIE